MNNVLVVGWAGYIGGCVTDLLIERHIPFTVYDNLTYENHYLKPVDFIHGDVRDREKLNRLLPDYSHVVWLAAIVGDGAYGFARVVDREDEALLQAGIRRLLSDVEYARHLITNATNTLYRDHEAWPNARKLAALLNGA